MIPPGILTYNNAATVYAAWDPAAKGANITLSGGNLTATNTAAGVQGAVIATIGKSTGKWYWEYHIDVAVLPNSTLVGISQTLAGYTNYLGFSPNSWGWYGVGSGDLYNNNTLVTAGPAGFLQGDYIAIALDLDNGKMWCGVSFLSTLTWYGFSGGVQAVGNPVTGTNPALTGLSGPTWYPAFGFKDDQVTANFGASTFHYAGLVPSGYHAGVFT